MTSSILKQISCIAKFPQWNKLQVASIFVPRLQVPPSFKDVEYPEKNKLRIYEKVPRQPQYKKPPILRKRLCLMLGKEEVHNKLIHKQYGIVALTGGMLHHGHFEVIRNVINKKMDLRRMFAVWRVDPPWKAITKKPQGKRMGGGKGSIHHYATPLKAGRIIFEMGGDCEFREVEPLLREVKLKLPFQAAVVSQTILEKEMKDKQELDKRNVNPFTMEYIFKNHMLGY